MLVPTAQEIWRLDSPDRFTVMAEECGETTLLYDGPSWADAQDVAEFWKRWHHDTINILGGAWAT